MLLALLLSVVLWSSPPPTIWICQPGTNPRTAGIECERLHYQVLAKFWVP